MLTQLKPKIEPLLLKLVGPVSFINPNILTLLGLIPPILLAVFLLWHWYWLAALMFLGVLFDTVDGAVARMTNRVTKFGAFLDSTLDRLADAVIISAFAFAGLTNFYLAITALVLALLISYTRSRAELAGNGEIKLNVGIMERTERTVALAITLILFAVFPTLSFSGLNLVDLGFIMINVLCLITLIQRIRKAYQLLA
jgi:archaetidylinositol phosphate synthase